VAIAKVLLVDDDEIVRFGLAELLEDKGFGTHMDDVASRLCILDSPRCMVEFLRQAGGL
jgi:CheY-like chemotaxis protein